MGNAQFGGGFAQGFGQTMLVMQERKRQDEYRKAQDKLIDAQANLYKMQMADLQRKQGATDAFLRSQGIAPSEPAMAGPEGAEPPAVAAPGPATGGGVSDALATGALMQDPAYLYLLQADPQAAARMGIEDRRRREGLQTVREMTGPQGGGGYGLPAVTYRGDGRIDVTMNPLKPERVERPTPGGGTVPSWEYPPANPGAAVAYPAAPPAAAEAQPLPAAPPGQLGGMAWPTTLPPMSAPPAPALGPVPGAYSKLPVSQRPVAEVPGAADITMPSGERAPLSMSVGEAERAGGRRLSPAQEAQAKSEAEKRTALQAEAPAVIAAAEALLTDVQGLEEHPGLWAATGPVVGRLPPAMREPLTLVGPGEWGDVSSFQARLDKVRGQQFLDAVEAIRGSGASTGLGPLSNQEGERLVASRSAMVTAQNPEDFQKAAKEFRRLVETAIKRTQANAERYGVDLTAPAGEGEGESALERLERERGLR
jgi:hypothetical protein